MRTGHAVRVAAITTAAIALVYVACVTAANLIVSVHLTAQTDARLSDRMSDLRQVPADVAQRLTRPGIDDDDDDDDDESPVVGWLVGPDRRVIASTAGRPGAPGHLASGAQAGQTLSAPLGQSGPYRLQLARSGADVLVVGLPPKPATSGSSAGC